MQGWNKRTLVLMLALLIFVPPGVEAWLLRREYRRDQRRDGLIAHHQISVSNYACTFDPLRIDFDGDGDGEYLIAEWLPGLSERWLTVVEADGRTTLLRLPFTETDGSRRVRLALNREFALPHLLVYDGVNYHTPLMLVYAFDGRRLSQIPPTPLEREILSAMASHDDTGGWHERVFRGTRSAIKLVCYYFVLGVIIFVIAYRRFAGPSAHSGYHFLRGQP